jgi:serine/threonine protein kinase
MRLDTVGDFLELLEKVEDEATAPDREHFVEDPSQAKKDDELPGGFRVIRRLGQGACSVVLLVARGEDEYVLKVASDPEHNARLQEEAEVVKKLRHSHIVELIEHDQKPTLEIGDRIGFLLRPVFANKDDRRIETLRDRLGRDGRLHVDLLQRFGEDLLDVVRYLEEEVGIPHRDLKPDNIAIGQIKRGDKLHLVLFDFSLSRTPPENIRAGTTGYLDPMLPLRKPPRWDLHAERYAAAVTLYELAAGPGVLPKWGDGASDPSHIDSEVAIDGDLFDASLRDSLSDFFRKALRRDPAERFDNAEQMLSAWRDCFVGIEDPGSLSDHAEQSSLERRLAEATRDTHIAELELGTRATNALDRANVLTVEDLLTIPLRRLQRLRGVGNKTRREISAAVRLLRDRLGSPQHDATELPPDSTTGDEEPANVAELSVDLIAQRLTRSSARDGDTARLAIAALLGLDRSLDDPWPSQTEIARHTNVTRARIGQLVGKFQARWAKDTAITQLRADVAEFLDRAGGVMAMAELAEAILADRGSVQDEPIRTQLATALGRACVEVERTMAEPRFLVNRSGNRVLIAKTQALGAYAARLGEEADQLAGEDPLVPPARALQRLREIPIPADETVLSDSRLVRLAAAASQTATLSSRQELYPRGMDASRALKLSQGALYGVAQLTVDQIRDRVRSRYPEAALLPDRPALDAFLRDANFDFDWDSSGKGGGCYVSRHREAISVTSGSESVSRLPTAVGWDNGADISPEIADARQFEDRLVRALRDGAFLALTVNPKYYERAADELCRRFAVELIDFEGLFIDSLREVVTNAGAKWDAVVNADAAPNGDAWKKFLVLVNRAMPMVEERLFAADKTVLLIYPGLLARYDQMTLLQRLRDGIGRSDGLSGLWLLVPGDAQAMIDDKPVPIISPGQRIRVPESWLQNAHRGQRVGAITA